MIKPVYGYLRVSGKKQISGHGFKRQLDSINKFCKKAGYKIDKIYQEAISGTKGEADREEFSAMVADILSNGIHVVVVESLDRLAREYRIQEQLLVYLASRNIDLIAANTGENVTQAISDDPMKKALIQMQGIFAELDKSLLVRKLRKARDKTRKEKGRCEGPKFFGETPEEKEILKRVRYMRRLPRGLNKRRRTYQSIADELNSEGIKTRQGKKWDAALVYNILKKKK